MTKAQDGSISVNGVKLFYAILAWDSWSLCIHFRTLWLSNLCFLMVRLTVGMAAMGCPQLRVELVVLEHKVAAALVVVCHPSPVLTLGG